MNINNFLCITILIICSLFPLLLTTSFFKRVIALFQTMIFLSVLVLLQFQDFQSENLEASIIVVIVPMLTLVAFLYYYLKSRLKV